VDFVRLIQMPKVDPHVDPSTAYVQGFIPLKQRLTRKEIKWASSGGRIRAERADPNQADDGAETR